VNDAPATDPGQLITAADLGEALKLTAGRKRHALVVTG
jgi:tyrosyl-tRNA synthetase